MSKGLKGYTPDSARWPVLRHGLVFFKDASVVCFVLNRSRGGAGLVLQNDVSLPLVFDLEIDGENIRRRCVAVWRDQCRIGVSFDMDRALATADKGPVEGEAACQPVVLTTEQSLAQFLRFAAMTDVYKTASMSGASTAESTSEQPDAPDKRRTLG